MSVVSNTLLLTGDDGYQISRSVRLRSSASAYFSRTPASASNRTTWTWSGWVKLGQLSTGTNQAFFAAGNTSAGDYIQLAFDGTTQALYVTALNSSAVVMQKIATAVYRDPSAWYHIVYAYDSTQATSTNRIKMYVNGIQITSFSTNTDPALNTQTLINSANQHTLSSLNYTSRINYFDGYMTEVNFIDGQQLTPSSFGETDSITGVWKPKKYAGTYGTNGFYLNFSDPSAATAAAIGKDSSGNGNNWTPNNISVTAGVTYDSMIDTPTMYADGGNGRGNYCTLNPLQPASTTVVVPTDGNLKMTGTASGNNVTGTMAIVVAAYFEGAAITGGGTLQFGVKNLDTGNTYAYDSSGNKSLAGSSTSYGATFTTSDVIGVAVDPVNLTLQFYKNGASQGVISSAFPAGNYVPFFYASNTNASAANFGQRPFAYTPPTGFKALNTQNLPAGSITTSGSFTGNASADGPFVYLNGVPTAMTINGNAVTFATHVDKTANGFKLRTSSSSYNASGSNTYSITTTGAKFKYANAQGNP